MGIFDKLFKKQEKQEEREERRSWYPYTARGTNPDSIVEFFNTEEQGGFEHRDGSYSKLITARMIEHRIEDAVIFDAANYVCFEMEKEMTMEQLERDGVLEAFVKYGYLQNLDRDHFSYIGRITSQIERKGQRMYHIQPREKVSQVVLNHIQKTLDPKITKEREILEQRREASRQEQHKRDLSMRERLEQQAKQYKEETKKREWERLQRLQVKETRSSYFQDGKECRDFDGVNILNGEVLRILQAKKIGKNPSGVYLYSAFLHTTPNEEDVQFLDGNHPYGIPVIFELPSRIQDVFAGQDREMIRNVLEMLSSSEKDSSRESLTYIGGINQESQRYTEPSSEFKEEIERLQHTFLRKKEEQRYR